MSNHKEPSQPFLVWRAAGERPGPSGAWRESWQRWRRTRPFWGGLLLALGGLELIAIPLSGVLGHGAIRLVIYIGIGGVFGVLIGALMITCGVLICVNPAHRTFYGIAGILLGILSFPASNLGGFFIGMLLAIAGGGIAFAWTPLAPDPDRPVVIGAPGESWEPDEPTDPGSRGFKNYRYYEEFEPPEGLDELDEPDEPDEAEESGEPEEFGEPDAPGESEAPSGLRYLAVAAMPLLLAASLLGAPSAPGARTATAAPQRAAGSCILLIICLPSPNPTPTPTPSPSSPGTGSGPQPSGSPSPGQPGGSGQPGKSGHKGKHPKADGPDLEAATATSVITAGSATLDGFVYRGAANVPTAGGGTVKMMKFTANSMALSGDVTATVTQRRSTAVTTSPTFDFTGSVVLYATKLSGCLGALCVTLTPGNAVTVLLRLTGGVTGQLTLTLTKVVTDQPLVIAGALQSGRLSLSAG
jgi:Family of unknown function (DUF6114)